MHGLRWCWEPYHPFEAVSFPGGWLQGHGATTCRSHYRQNSSSLPSMSCGSPDLGDTSWASERHLWSLPSLKPVLKWGSRWWLHVSWQHSLLQKHHCTCTLCSPHGRYPPQNFKMHFLSKCHLQWLGTSVRRFLPIVLCYYWKFPFQYPVTRRLILEGGILQGDMLEGDMLEGYMLQGNILQGDMLTHTSFRREVRGWC